jgi:RNA polymerase sigma-70 factor (ECF subfamily)
MNATRAELRDVLEKAQRAWPGVDVPDEIFFAHVEAHLGDDALDTLATTELFLAVGCAIGAPSALQAFEAAFAGELAATVRRTSSSVDVDELLQQLREMLFVAREGRPPRIADYRGRGGLRAWLRVVATRATLNAASRGPKEKPARSDEHLFERTDHAESAELAYFRIHYESEVRSVLPEALAAISARERLYLRQHYLDQLTLGEMSRMHRVHAATIKRHLAQAKERLSEELRARLCERLGLSPSEFESVLAMIRTRFHMSMRTLLPPHD